MVFCVLFYQKISIRILRGCIFFQNYHNHPSPPSHPPPFKIFLLFQKSSFFAQQFVKRLYSLKFLGEKYPKAFKNLPSVVHCHCQVLVYEQDGIHCTRALVSGIEVGQNPLYLCSRSCSWFRSRMEWNTPYLCSGSWYRSRMEQNPLYLCSRSWYRSRIEPTVPVLQILLLVQKQDGIEYTVPVLQVLIQKQDGIHCTWALGPAPGLGVGWNGIHRICALGPGIGVGWNRIHCICALVPNIGVGWNPLYLGSRSWYRSRGEQNPLYQCSGSWYKSKMGMYLCSRSWYRSRMEEK